VFVLAICRSLIYLTISISSFSVVLHPYFKLAYIKHVLGSSEEQEAEHKAGNPLAKDWQSET
jgi:hypothetical protein